MASKFNSTILASNLESLTDKTSQLAEGLKAVQQAATGAGSAISDMAKSSMGDIQALTAQMARLTSAIQRTSTTSSAVGAASVSGALSQLTGQARGGGGGGGGGGVGGGGGTSFPGLIGGGGGNIISSMKLSELFSGSRPPEGSWRRKIYDRIQRLKTRPGFKAAQIMARGAVALGKFSTGLTMAGMQQGRNARARWEQARYYSPILGVDDYARDGAITEMFNPFRKDLGLDAWRGAEIGEGISEAMGGRGGTSTDWLNYTKLGARSRLAPEAMNPLSGALVMGGQGMGQAMGQQRAIFNQSGRTARSRLGAGASSQELQSAQVRNAKLMNQGLARFFGQQAGISRLQPGTLQQAAPFLGALGRGFPDQTIANNVFAQLRAGTLSPGGGEAGEVLNLQAAGFGNPYLAADRETAQRLGVRANLQRRNYLEARLFREENPVDMILNQMIGVATRYRGQNTTAQGYGLATVSGLSLSQSKDLMRMLQSGSFSESQLRSQINTARNLAAGESGTGAGGIAISKQLGHLNNTILTMGDGLKNFSDELNTIQVALYRIAAVNSESLSTAMKQTVKMVSEFGSGNFLNGTAAMIRVLGAMASVTGSLSDFTDQARRVASEKE